MNEECKKYELLPSPIVVNGCTAYKIKALQSFGNVAKGQIGGVVSSEGNLSHLGCCWIYDNGAAVGNAKVYGNAAIRNISWGQNITRNRRRKLNGRNTWLYT